ncbi:MAG: MarR family winged helix-turn-helix transcriptional regulator [Hyphomonadaceae bacterium]
MADTTGNTTLRLGDFLPYRFSVLSNTISKQIASRYQTDFGLTLWQWRVMAVIGERTGLSASDIVSLTAMDKVAVSRAVTGLIEQGRLERVTAAADARRSYLHLTAAGQDIYDKIVPLAQAELDRIAATLSETEFEQLNQILTKLAEQASPDRPLW